MENEKRVIVRRCSCGAEYTAAEWEALERTEDASYPWGEVLELRHCAVCTSTMSSVLKEGNPP